MRDLKIRAEAVQRDEWTRTAAIRRDLYDRWKKEDAPDSTQIDPLIHNPMATRAERERWAKRTGKRRRKEQ